jgi:predicted transposase YbfD/YdcC
MEKANKIREYFADVETLKEHNGYFCSVGEALTIVILGTFCGLRNISQIQQWASNERITSFMRKYFGIAKIPCYYWLLCLMKIVKPKSLNQCFIRWTQSLLPDEKKGLTLSFDGKTICSTEKMESYESALHVVSAHIAELGITIGQQTVCDKSNEIPAVRELIGLLEIEGCLVVADALNCQKETAKAIINAKADYLLTVKDNHQTLREDIKDYVQDKESRKTMETYETVEKNRGRIERRTAYSTYDVEWIYGKDEWAGLVCIGAINRRTTTKKGETDEWHYYISSRQLSAKELLYHARLEWSVESVHWLLDVHFDEDFCRVEDKNMQQSLNIVRKIILNSIKVYKNKTGSIKPISKIMMDCLLDFEFLMYLLTVAEN